MRPQEPYRPRRSLSGGGGALSYPGDTPRSYPGGGEGYPCPVSQQFVACPGPAWGEGGMGGTPVL